MSEWDEVRIKLAKPMRGGNASRLRYHLEHTQRLRQTTVMWWHRTRVGVAVER